MTDIAKLYDEHATNRVLFEQACISDDMSQEDFLAVRTLYNASLNAYLAAIERRSVSLSNGAGK